MTAAQVWVMAMMLEMAAGGGDALAGAAPPDAVAALPPSDVSAAALYNLGNAYARQGHVGLAVLAYERARIRAPRDSDITANLTQLRSAARLSTAPESWLQNHARIADPDLVYWLGVAGLVLAGSGVLSVRFRPGRRGIGYAALLAGAPLCGVTIIDACATWPVMHEGVILHATSGRVSPAGAAQSLFDLPEGEMVRISDGYREFVLVATEGRAGWVPRSDLAPLT